jgi:hypothetical protein
MVFFLFVCLFFFWLIDGCFEHLASSTEVILLFNLENHSKSCVLQIVCSQKANLNTGIFYFIFPRTKADADTLFKSAISRYTKITC